MAETMFSPPSMPNFSGMLHMDLERISGRGGPIYPQLNVLLRVSLESAELAFRRNTAPQTPEDLLQDYSLHQIYGTLFFSSQGSGVTELTKFQSLPISHLSRTNPKVDISLDIPLDLYRLHLLEELRVGDVSLQFTFQFHLIKYYQAPRKQTHLVIEQFETSWINQFIVTVPQSHWIDKVLPGLGYGKISLVEVPIPEKAIGETIVKAVEEFQVAQHSLLQGDYNKALGHCRNALEIFSNARKYEGDKERPSFADKIDYLLMVLPSTPTGARGDNLRRLLKDLYGLTSMPEHPSPPHFTRDDADMTIHITIAVLSYLGKFLSR